MTTIKNKAPTIARIFLGLLFTVFGLNGFLNFMPMPETTEAGGAFLGALAATGYMFPLIKATEVVAGVMLLSGLYVPLSLALLAPVTVNILLFHTVLAPAPAMPLMILAAQIFLTYTYRGAYQGMLQAKTLLPVATKSFAPAPHSAGASLSASS